MFGMNNKNQLFFAMVTTCFCGFFLFGSPFFTANKALAQELYVYPEKGQGQEQMEKEKFECYTWAKGQTGFDPMEVPTATAPPPAQQAPKGGAGRGAAVGATTGAVTGAIIKDDPGKGAAIGAVTGALIGGIRRQDQQKSQQQAEQQWAEEQAYQYAQKRNAYDRAYGACLEGRGYSVK